MIVSMKHLLPPDSNPRRINPPSRGHEGPEVQTCSKGFFKYWWDEEMHVLKDAAIESNKIWITAGKPKHGPIFHERQSCRSQYRKRLREGERLETETYTND